MTELSTHAPPPRIFIPAEFVDLFKEIVEGLFRECRDAGALVVTLPAEGPPHGDELCYAGVPAAVHEQLHAAGVPFRVDR